MNRIFIALLFLSSLSCQTENEQKETKQLNELNIELIVDLELLGKVWGFLKYHHPEVAKGKYDWDDELFKIIPNYLEAESTSKRNKILIDWIDSLGEIESCIDCRTMNKGAFLKPDQRWIKKLDKKLKTKLIGVYNSKPPSTHHYIEFAQGVGNPIFKNEEPYSSVGYPDEYLRMLAVYRFWNMVEYFFPYKHQTDSAWDGVLRAYIPVLLAAKDRLEYELALTKLVSQVNDSHCDLWEGAVKREEWKGTYSSVEKIGFIEGRFIVIDYYKTHLEQSPQLKIGDEITKINGKNIATLIEEMFQYYPASNNGSKLRNISRDLLRSNSSELAIEYKSIGDQNRKTILKLLPRDSIDLFNESNLNGNHTIRSLKNEILYITLETIQRQDISEIIKRLPTSTGVIIDIRNYPSYFVPFDLGSLFVSEPTPFVKFTQGNFMNPGEFTFTSKLKIYNYGSPYEKKLVVLVNEQTQSQAEYTAMAFQAGVNTTVVGSTTAGADGNISRIYLPGGIRTVISGIGVYYPDGTETQRVGIVPDIFIKPTINGIRQQRDEVLEAAIEFILNE